MEQYGRLKLKIPQADPHAEYSAYEREINDAVLRVMGSGVYILSKEVSHFESEFGRWLGGGHVVGLASGTDALEVSFRALGIGVGDLVFTVPLTSVATVAAIQRCGAVPFLVDAGRADMLIDPGALDATVKVARRSRSCSRLRPAAVVPVHLYGMPAEMNEIMAIARKYELKVVEDCAQAHGASLRYAGKWRKAGTVGDAAAFSFYPTKNLGAIGDGGAALFRRSSDAVKARSIRQYGWDSRRISQREGVNSRLDELQAAILRVKLKHLKKQNSLRCALADVYDRALAASESVETPPRAAGRKSVYHQYVIRVKNRGGVVRKLRGMGIGTAIHYPVPVHMQPAFCDSVIYKHGSLGVAEELCRTVLSLPMFPELRVEAAARVASAVLKICGKPGRDQRP